MGRDTIRRNVQDFSLHWQGRIAEWRKDGATHTEKSYAQQYWSDLLRCFGVIPERIDLFERDAQRASTGNVGYIDLFWSGVVLGEAKSLGRDLDLAFSQALDYLSGGSVSQHEFPRYIMVSDFENIHLIKMGHEGWTVRFTLAEIVDHIDQLMFLAGQETVSKEDEEEASIHASQLMADLYTAMLSDEVDAGVGEDAATNPEDEEEAVQRTSMWLTRLLFLLYGDDAGLWEEDLFYRFVLYDTTPATLGAQLNGLFQVLNTPIEERRRVPASMAKFPYVNGSIFADHMRQEFFDEKMRDALLRACRFYWTRISPAVFGSMFQLVKSKEARRAHGEHYTAERNILKVIEPLFLDEFREEAARLLNSPSSKPKQLRAFQQKLSECVFLDPACGCGNFLVVAYRELRRIETDIIVGLREREDQFTASLDVSLDQKLTIDQFHGIELNWWPAKIAETAMFLVDHQANRELASRVGDAPNRLPIRITAHIHHGNALRLDWADLLAGGNGNPETLDELALSDERAKESLTAPVATAYPGPVYVFGNPPFIGQYTKTKDQTADMKAVWGRNYNGYLDYVTGWHAQTMKLLADREGEFAYVTTNSITQGQPVPALFGPLFDAGWRIKFAHRTFAWDSEAPGKAAVHCVIVGFDRDHSVKQRLWDYPMVNGDAVPVPVKIGINAYLADGANVLVEKRMKPLSSELPEAARGSQPTDGGNLIVEVADYPSATADPIAAKYLRSYRMGRELVRGLDRWCLWMADDDFDPKDINRSPILKQRVSACKDFREKSTPTGDAFKLRTIPHLFRPNKDRPLVPYVAIPAVVSETRNFFTADHYPAEVIVGNQVYTALDADGLLFGFVSSSMFIAWQRAVGGRLESRLRFSNTVVWNNFPVPPLDDASRSAIIEAGKGVLKARALYPERSLADHYNPLAMDPKLLKAHDKLDRAVDKAFGAPRKLATNEQRLELLFANYARMIAQEQ